MSMNEKDIVAARINLDTSKIASSFKNIDTGVKQNAESFKLLNEQLAAIAKSYETVASVADKLALSADERRKKILAESDALVNQRNAQANYYNAKASTIDQSNNLIKAKMDLQYKLIQQADQRIELEAERHAAQMARIEEQSAIGGKSTSPSFFGNTARYALGVAGGIATFSVLDQLTKIPQIVGDVSASMTKLKQVLEIAPNYEKSPQKLTDDLKQLQDVAGIMAQAYGVDFATVLDTMSQAGRKFKNVSDIVVATDSALQLTAVDSVDASKSIGAMEAIMSQFGLTTTQARQALFEITAAAHEFQTTGSDLTDAITRSGSSFATMKMNTAESIAAIATLSQMTAQDGATVGNAWKSIENSLSSDKSVKALKELGIQVYDANGNLKDSVQLLQDIQAVWPKLSDAAKQHYATVISGGKYQYGRLEAFLNDYGNTYQKALDAIKNANEQQQQELVKSEMESIPKQFDATKASFQVMANSLATQVTPALIGVMVEIRNMDNSITNNIDSIDKLVKMGLTLVEAYAVWKVSALAYSSAVKVVDKAVQDFNTRLEIADANSAGTISAFKNMGQAALGMAGAVAESVAKMALLYTTTVAINSLIERVNNPDQFKIDDLQNRLRDLQNLQQSSGGAWSQIKQGVSNGLNIFGDTVKDTATLHFGSAWQDIKNGLTVNPQKDQNSISAQIQTIQQQLDAAKAKKTADDQAEMEKALKQEQDLIKKYADASGKLTLPGADNNSADSLINSFGNGGAFSFPLKNIDTQVKQAEALISDASNAIDLFNAKAFTMTDEQQKTVNLTDLYAAHQKSLADANISLRNTLDQLNGKQNELNGLLADGKITSDEYNQATDEVQSRIDSVTQEVNKNSTAWWNDKKSMKDATDQMLKDSYDFSSKWIAHQKAIGQLDTQQELDAWERVQARYQEGTQERMQADEQVYAAKQALIQKEQTAADDMLAKEKDRINQAKQAFDDAQDAKIKAIDAQIQAQDQANSDADYQTKLQEKEARAKVLESGVGSQAKEELKNTLQDIADMKQQHDRELAKRDLESKKQSLQDQKDAQDKTYDALLQSFDTYKNSAYQIEDAIKQFRIKSNDEANAQILNQLDEFIASYKAKMVQLSPIANATSQQDISKIYAPGDMAGAAAIGAIAGLPTSAKFPFPTVSMPSVDYSKPQTNVTNVYQFDNSIGSIALAGLGAAAGLMDQRTGLIARQQAMGTKVR